MLYNKQGLDKKNLLQYRVLGLSEHSYALSKTGAIHKNVAAIMSPFFQDIV